MDKIKNFVKTLGFPVAVALILLYFCFHTIGNNTQAINNLDKSISGLTQLIEMKLVNLK
jgi:hypothetical protein